MKFILIGGSGFVGTNLSKFLVNKNHLVINISRKKRNFTIKNEYYFKLDKKYLIRKKKIFENAIIIFLIGKSHNSSNYFNYSSEVKSEIDWMNFFFNISQKKKCKWILISSGGTIYGDSKKTNSEKDELKSDTTYSLSNYIKETLFKIYSNFFKYNYIILRLSNPFGPHQNFLSKQGIISKIIFCILKNKKLNLLNNGEIIRDFIYIDDVCEAIEKISKVKFKNSIYNLGSGKGVKIKKIVELTQSFTKKKLNYVNLKHSQNIIKRNVLNITKIKKEIKWTPKTSLSSGIKKTYSWILNEKL